MRYELDTTDRQILAALATTLRPSPTVIARKLGLARGTAYSRLDRLEKTGVIEGYVPSVNPSLAGFGVVSFTTLEIEQGSHDETTRALAEIEEIVEIYTVTGAGDILCRILAVSNEHLHAVIQRVAALPTVTRSQSQLALATVRPNSIVGLVAEGPKDQGDT